ncbi:transglutaminase [Allosaccharopolyspora coralli]|uniref:Transglutaminase n=1 Tax=Allosaccharopolyspora coralli TaxID=2665642 RepID=A0A5Q3Q8M5_9PSEU|nr:DUF3488 and transglutaminase-like domain-containing protein [Allosaccharopolyspora coralli]QGK70908.1 transglutaminase [Allosaccharopolyspora coralli]
MVVNRLGGAAEGSAARGSAAQSVAVAAAVLLSSTAFSAIFADASWFLPALIMVAAITAIGAVTRSAGWRSPLIALTQLVAIAVLMVTLFSGQAVLGVLPGPASIGEVLGMLGQAGEVVRTGVPPVPADPPLQALLALGLGLVTVFVDVLAVSAGAPAVAGLVLLCLYALPASLADLMLPWWAFAAGAAGFAGLLVVGGRHPTPAGSPESGRSTLRQHAVAIGAATTALALFTGAAFTGVGTDGSLPGSRDSSSEATDGMGIRPFTSLRGQLDRDRVVELFRVTGLPQEAYLRAMTLRRFDPERGWDLEGLTQGVGADGRLPAPNGSPLPAGRELEVTIEPLGYRDPWLPIYGVPLDVSGMGEDWRYDPAAGIIFTQQRQPSRPYTERFLLPDPPATQLRSNQPAPEVDPAYLDTSGITPDVADLARRITTDEATEFDKAVALNRLFTDPANGFRYELETAPPTSADGVADFLFRGKRGYCEQFASAMAVLLRAVGIPSRVAVGFTAGTDQGETRTITTDDAHAWVEAHLPGVGWTTFDPTPLDDGRTALPNYLDRELNPTVEPQPMPGETVPPGEQPPGQAQENPRDESGVPPPGPGASGGSGWWPALAALVLALATLGAPLGFRELRRRRRVRASAEGSASAAWSEVLDQSWDRGTTSSATETARAVAGRLIHDHELDSDGAHALRGLVTAVEQHWYGHPEAARRNDSDLGDLLGKVLASFERNDPLSWRERLLPRSVLRPSGTTG